MDSEMILDLTIAVTNIVGLILCNYFFNSFLIRKVHGKSTLGLFYLSIASFFIATNLLIENLSIFILISIVVYSVTVLFCFEGNFIIRLISGLFFVTFGVVIEVITGLLLSFILHTSIDESLNGTASFITGAFVSKLIMLIVIKIIADMIAKRDKDSSIKNWGIMITIPVVSIFITSHILYQNRELTNNNMGPFLAVTGILYINLIAFGLFESIVGKVVENNRYRYANRQLMLQQEHYKRIMEGHQVTRGLWHDMKNHLISIEAYIEKQEYSLAKASVESIQTDLDSSMKSIVSGNVVIDAILGNKMELAKNLGINIETNIIVPKELEMDAMDLCVILGNCLDNAIEACERLEDERTVKYIELMIQYKNGSILISVINPIDMKSIKMKKSKYASSKERTSRGENGFGIYNMERAVKKNDGNLKIHTENNKFHLNIMLPIDEASIEI